MKKLAWVFALPLVLGVGCGEEKYKKTPVDELIVQMSNEKEFTIILADMDAESHTFSTTYKHKYKIITNDTAGNPVEKTTDWIVVDEKFFDQHINDLGMEICSKSNGKVEKTVAPPGYSNYVGNPRYGSWQTDASGNSFWAFYGQYMFLSNMIGLMASPIYRSSYYDYRDNYRSYGRPYYGTTSNGLPAYGTRSLHSQTMHSDFHNRLNSNSAFKNRVNSSVMRSMGSRSNSRTSMGSSRRSSGGGK